MKKLIILILMFTFPLLVLAGKKPKNKMKFGKVTMEEMKMSSCDLDSTANAVVLGDFRKYSFDYIQNVGFKVTTEVFRRIKVLNNDGVDEVADFSISLYNHNGAGAKTTFFKAYTYNLDGESIIETKLDKDSKFIETSDYYTTYKYAFKDVKAGSVLEYKYSKSSNFTSDFDTWYPQEEIPVLWSELYVEYYEEIDFKYFVTGGVRPFYDEHNVIQGRVSDNWIYKNIPAIEQEAYMRDVKNYSATVDYELLKIAFQGSYYEDFTTSWQEIAKDIMKSDHFGGLLDNSRYYKEIVAHVLNDSLAIDEMTKVQSALTYIRNNYAWNKSNRYHPTWDFIDVKKDKKGNSSDLNILLMGSLKSLGIKAKPLVLSTRNNGVVFQSKPSTDDLNYTVTAFYIDGKIHVVDAATSYSSINMLPSKCLNGQGYVIDETAGRWVELDAGNAYQKRVFVQAAIDEELNITGSYQAKEIGYAAQKIRRNIISKGSAEKYAFDKVENAQDFSISEYSIQNENDLSKDVVVKFKFTSDVQIQEIGDLLGLRPILFRGFETSPFTKEIREFPVDFTYPISLDYTYIYTIPEGYVVDELPKPTRVSNEDKSIDFLLNTVARGNSITVSLKFNVKKAFFHTDKYAEIKSFFDYYIENQDQLIILKPE